VGQTHVVPPENPSGRGSNSARSEPGGHLTRKGEERDRCLAATLDLEPSTYHKRIALVTRRKDAPEAPYGFVISARKA
jgi:hypothetical protein